MSPAGTIERPLGRYVQLAIDLTTDEPLTTPRLKGVTIESQPAATPDWTARLRVIESDNQPIVRSSIPFEYEPFDHSDLRSLRERYKLDDVVQGASDRVRADLPPGGLVQPALGEGPSGRALSAVERAEDSRAAHGRHACRRLLPAVQPRVPAGLRELRHSRPGRLDRPGGAAGVASGSGHEVVEIWSNEHRKWVYVDGNCAWYAVDQETGDAALAVGAARAAARCLGGQASRADSRSSSWPRRATTWEGLTAWPPFSSCG